MVQKKAGPVPIDWRTVLQLTSANGKLTQAFGIDGDTHGQDVFAMEGCQITAAVDEPEPLPCQRIGISVAQDLLWRYIRRGSPSLSAPPQRA